LYDKSPLHFDRLFILDPEVHPQNEDYWGHVNPIGPRSCYDEGKRAAESLMYAYKKQVRFHIDKLTVPKVLPGFYLLEAEFVLN
jgi:hypothetical protein